MRSHLFFLAFCRVICAAPQVQLGKTTVLGTAFYPAGVEFFGGEFESFSLYLWDTELLRQGIPYAVPPVGERSLQLPVLTTTLQDDVLHAENFGFSCLQAVLFPHSYPHLSNVTSFVRVCPQKVFLWTVWRSIFSDPWEVAFNLIFLLCYGSMEVCTLTFSLNIFVFIIIIGGFFGGS